MRKIRRTPFAGVCILFICGAFLFFSSCAGHDELADSPAASSITIGISVPRSEEAPVTMLY